MSLVMPQAPVTRMERIEKCSGCKFHGWTPDGKAIDCRIKPPQSGLVADARGQPTPMSYFPVVMPDWWCGEFRPRIETGKPS
jgi:hypothetical protein